METRGWYSARGVKRGTALKAAAFFILIVLSSSLHCCLAQPSSREAVYKAASRLYADDTRVPLGAQVVSSGTYPESTWEKITYQGKADRVPALLFLPAKPAAVTGKVKPIPCILLLHGLGGSKEQMIPLARILASLGYASWAIDDSGSGERYNDNSFPNYASLQDLAVGISSQMEATVVDERRGLDYLDERPELDHGHFGLLGFSLGALLGGVLGGVDPRLKAAILVSGGGNIGDIMVDEAKANVAFGEIYPTLLQSANPAQLNQMLEDIDPINFVSHIAPRPILMEHGRLDTIIPPDLAQSLYDAAEQPKQIVWFPTAGHIPSPLAMYSSVSIFLFKYLPLPTK
jgi:fermentation-respiration switch protein FrsA (DUF1100 family)